MATEVGVAICLIVLLCMAGFSKLMLRKRQGHIIGKLTRLSFASPMGAYLDREEGRGGMISIKARMHGRFREKRDPLADYKNQYTAGFWSCPG